MPNAPTSLYVDFTDAERFLEELSLRPPNVPGEWVVRAFAGRSGGPSGAAPAVQVIASYVRRGDEGTLFVVRLRAWMGYRPQHADAKAEALLERIREAASDLQCSVAGGEYHAAAGGSQE